MKKRSSGNAIDHFIEILCKICEVICVVIVALIAIVTLVQVFYRFVLSSPLVWCEEFSRYAGIWLVMFSTALAIQQRSHMTIDLFVQKLPKIGQGVLMAFSDILIFGISVYMMFAQLTLTRKFFDIPSAAMRIPMGIVYTGILIGWVCCIVVSLSKLGQSISTIRQGEVK